MVRRMSVLLGIVALLALMLGVPGMLTHARADLTFASTDVLRPLFSHLLGDPPSMHLEVVPDMYEGGYARVSIYSRNVNIKGMLIDELWIKLVGASFDPAALREGTLKVIDLRDSAIYGKLNLASVQDFLNHQASDIHDVRLRLNGEAVVGTGTVLYNGVPTRVRMQGVFQVYGEPEVFFHIQALFVNSLPVPYVIVDHLERQINPVVDFRTWPIQFKIHSFRQTTEGFVLSSQRDFAQPCAACGGPPVQLAP
jgi:hypothetical protein